MPDTRLLPDHRVPARDGVTLAADVVLPAGDGPFGAVMVRTPYGRTFQRDDAARLAAAHDVAFVLQDVRGRFDSGGTFDLGATDAADGADTVAWIASQPWCDGRVASRGTSYPGITQWRAALEHPRDLIAIAPMMAPPWWVRMGFREGGAIQLMLAAHWLPLQAAWHPDTPDDARERMFARAANFEAIVKDDRVDVDAALDDPALSHLPLADPWLFEGSERFSEIWRRLFDPPDTVSWLDDPGPAPDETIAVPAFVVGAWYDISWATGQVRAFAHLQASSPDLPHRLVMAPTGHGFDRLREYDPGPETWRFALDSDAEWAAEWLHDRVGPLRSLPPVTYFTLGADEWRHADTFPPPGAATTSLHLVPDGMALSPEPPPTTQDVTFVYDPHRPVPTRGGAGIGLPLGPCDQADVTGDARDDVVSFTSAPLREPMEISGEVTAIVHLASDRPDTDVTVKLCHVSPSGRVESILDGILRGRYRHGGGEAVLLAPGEVERFGVHLGCVSFEVPAGHAMRVDVSSSNFPKFDRNPNTGAPEGTDMELAVARNTIVCSPEHPSRIQLPTLGRTHV